MGLLRDQLNRRPWALFTPLVAVLVLAGCATSAPVASPPAQAGSADLKISISFDGKSVDSEYHLLCDGDQAKKSSTLPEANEACQLLMKDPELLTAKVSGQQSCTEIYGGPATATVKGKLGEQPIQTSFDRHNGCAIATWDALAPLLGEGLQ